MKNRKSSPIIFVLLTSVSIFCYVYLHSVAVQEYGACPSSFSLNQKQIQEEQGQQESKVIFPDIALMKKILNITKIVMPSE